MKNIAPVLMVFGQSNAVGRDSLPPEETIHIPLKHVFMLPGELNRSFSPAPVRWKGYTSEDSNLGVTAPDKGCIPTEYARLWEKTCGEDPTLPDLYLLYISIGAQGVVPPYMWNPLTRERVLQPGVHGSCRISLYPYSTDLITRALDDLRQMGKTPFVLGLHWLGTEQETGCPAESVPELFDLHMMMIGGWRAAARCRVPVKLYYIRSVENARLTDDVDKLENVNRTFDRLAAVLPEVSCVDSLQAPFCDLSRRDCGLYMEDVNHYTVRTQRWLAERAFREELTMLKKEMEKSR